MMCNFFFNSVLNHNDFEFPPPTGEYDNGGVAIIIITYLQQSSVPLSTPLLAIALSVLLDGKITLFFLDVSKLLDYVFILTADLTVVAT